MEFVQDVSSQADALYADDLSDLQSAYMYDKPPQEEISLDDFEILALERLRLLRNIEEAKLKNTSDIDLWAMVQKQMPLTSVTDMNQDAKGRVKAIILARERARRDILSHFILRLAYCRTEELRRWFMQQEMALLKLRLEKCGNLEYERFSHANNISFKSLSRAEQEDPTLVEAIEMVARKQNVKNGRISDYKKVPFVEALSLVTKRAVVLRGGFAYVHKEKLASTVLVKFRAHLSRSMADAARMFEDAVQDPRIAPLLKNMNKQYIGKDFSKSANIENSLRFDQVDEAAKVHMPLCMKNLHAALKRDHKVKHWGRLQYGLFLKGAGLDMDDAMRFWESHFGKVMGHDEFVKQYAYSFRHMYGKEGNRKNYTPYSCMKIIMGSAPEPGAFHGCPYRHASESQLGAMINDLHLDSKQSADMLKTAREGKYQVACQMHFDATHPGHLGMNLETGDSVANHPNQWFQTSVEYHRVKGGGVGGSTAATSASAVSKTIYASAEDAMNASSQDADLSMTLTAPDEA